MIATRFTLSFHGHMEEQSSFHDLGFVVMRSKQAEKNGCVIP